jgi:WD40 repeat protein
MEYEFVIKKRISNKAIERCQFINNTDFIVLGEDKYCKIWTIKNNKVELLKDYKTHDAWTYGYNYSKDIFITFDESEKICVYDYNYNYICSLIDDDINRNLFYYSAIYNDYIITGSTNGIISIWDYKIKKIIKKFYFSDVNELYINNDLLYVVDDMEIQIIDLKKLEFVKSINCDQMIIDLLIYKDLLIIGGFNGLIYIYNNKLHTLDEFIGHLNWISTMHVIEKNNKNYLLTTCATGKIKYWEIINNKIKFIKEIKTDIGSISRSYLINNKLLTCSTSGRNRLINIDTEEEQIVGSYTNQSYDATVSLNNRYIVTSGGEGQITVYRINRQSAIYFTKLFHYHNLLPNDIIYYIYDFIC